MPLTASTRRTKTAAAAVGFSIATMQKRSRSPPEKLAAYAQNLLAEAKAAVGSFALTKAPDKTTQARIAAYAIRLAKLDTICRAGELDPDYESAAPEDVQDLVDLLAVVPFEGLLHPKIMLLNPTFGSTSSLVGGADTDLISGDLLVDFKTTKIGETKPESLDQLFGSFLLARKERSIDPTFPEINRVALYFCRHGHLWPLEASQWTSHPEFLACEEWFFWRAEEQVKAAEKAQERNRDQLKVALAKANWMIAGEEVT